ncbi:MAG TPA: hypothetical protein PKO44_08260, partial [Candidatus Omnitrophota bacterium]|nr:hypothetical protein [Candidatus Omnitrophota bacterium]
MGTLLKVTQVQTSQLFSTAGKINSKGAFGVVLNTASRTVNFVSGGRWGLNARGHLIQMGQRAGVSGVQGWAERGIIGSISGPVKFSLFSEAMASVIRGDVGQATYEAISSTKSAYWDYFSDKEIEAGLKDKAIAAENQDRSVFGNFVYSLSRQRFDNDRKMKAFGQLSTYEQMEKEGSLFSAEQKKEYADLKAHASELKAHAKKAEVAEVLGMIAFSRLPVWGEGGIIGEAGKVGETVLGKGKTIESSGKKSSSEKAPGVFVETLGAKAQASDKPLGFRASIKEGAKFVGEKVGNVAGKAVSFVVGGIAADIAFYSVRGRNSKIIGGVLNAANTSIENLQNKLGDKAGDSLALLKGFTQKSSNTKLGHELSKAYGKLLGFAIRVAESNHSFFNEKNEIKIDEVIEAINKTELGSFKNYKERLARIENLLEKSINQSESVRNPLVQEKNALHQEIADYITRNNSAREELQAKYLAGKRTEGHQELADNITRFLRQIVVGKLVESLQTKTKTTEITGELKEFFGKMGSDKLAKLGLKLNTQGEVWTLTREGKKLGKLAGQVTLMQARTGSGKSSVGIATAALLGTLTGQKSLVLSYESDASEVSQNYKQAAEFINAYAKKNGHSFKAGRVENKANFRDLKKQINNKDIILLNISDSNVKGTLINRLYKRSFLKALKARDALVYQSENMNLAALMNSKPGMESKTKQTQQDIEIVQKLYDATKDVKVIVDKEGVFVSHWRLKDISKLLPKLVDAEGKLFGEAKGEAPKNFEALAQTKHGKESIAYITALAWAKGELRTGRQVYNKETSLINPVDRESGTINPMVRVRDRYRQVALHVADAAATKRDINAKVITADLESSKVSDYDVVKMFTRNGINMVKMSGTVSEGMLNVAKYIYGADFISQTGKASELFENIQGSKVYKFSTSVSEANPLSVRTGKQEGLLSDLELSHVGNPKGKNHIIFNLQMGTRENISGVKKGLQGEFLDIALKIKNGKVLYLDNSGKITEIKIENGKFTQRVLKQEGNKTEQQQLADMMKNEGGLVVLAERNWAIGKTMQGKELTIDGFKTTDKSIALVDQSTHATLISQWGGRFRWLWQGKEQNNERTVEREIFIRN